MDKSADLAAVATKEEQLHTALAHLKGEKLSAIDEVEAARAVATAADPAITHANLAARLNLAANLGGYDGVALIADAGTDTRVARDA
jgi:hypothetical protein